MVEVFYDDTDPAILYSSSWMRAQGSIYRQGSIHRTRKLGASAIFKFHGTSIALMGAEGWDHGNFTVNLDGAETAVDANCCVSTTGGYPQIIQFEAKNLSPDIEHTITVTNMRSSDPSKNCLEIDGFFVTPIPKTPAKTFSRNLLILLVLVALVFLAYRARRWLVGITAKASAGLGASTNDSSSTGLSSHRPAPSRGGNQPDYAYEALEAGPLSSSSRHVETELDDELVDEIALRVNQKMGKTSRTGGAAGPLEDRVLDQIAHRVANIVQGDAPPSYSESTSSS